MTKLIEWKKIGVALSAFWVMFVLGTILADCLKYDLNNSRYKSGNFWEDKLVKDPKIISKPIVDESTTLHVERPNKHRVSMKNIVVLKWETILQFLFLPILLFWSSSYIIYRTIRWVAIGSIKIRKMNT